MLSARYFPYRLNFKFDAGTSRGVLKNKDSWFIEVWDQDIPEIKGIGECSLINGLSPDKPVAIKAVLEEVCNNINHFDDSLKRKLIEFPAIRFGLETALRDLETGGKKILYDSPFTKGVASIPINGLIWMGKYQEMLNRIHQKTEEGYACLKMKVGAISFEEELKLLRLIRQEFSQQSLELRLDANGAFSASDALTKLEKLAVFQIHSIEQPIHPRQWELMTSLCKKSPIPIALDEELIGISNSSELSRMLAMICPKYIILKPSLIGGLSVANSFIQAAENSRIGWWVTSALESNIGLNAIAQWAYTLNNPLPQGLGTGQLYTNNFDSPLAIEQGRLHYRPSISWNMENLLKNK